MVGSPVSHSRSPALHNAAMADAGFDGVYLPFLVDDFARFAEGYRDRDFAGFSVTIPHKACPVTISGALGTIRTRSRTGPEAHAGCYVWLL